MAWQKIEPSQEPTWDYKKDKTFVGVFKGMDTEVGPNASNLYHFENKESGDMAVWGNTVLDLRFKHLIIGEEVKVEYKGLAKSVKTGREYHDFDVYRDVLEDGTVKLPDAPKKAMNEEVDEDAVAEQLGIK